MRHRTLSLVVAGLVILSTTVGAFAQVVSTGRVDQIVGFTQTQGVPAVASGTFTPQVTATDEISAGQGTVLAPYIQDLDAFFATRFGWRPSKPLTVLLYSNGTDLTNALGGFRGSALSPDEATAVLSQPAVFTTVSQSNGTTLLPGDYAILVNTDVDAAAQNFNAAAAEFASLTNQPSLFPGTTGGTSQSIDMATAAMTMIEESIARRYADAMITDLSGANSPAWFREGLGDAIAFSIVPGTPMESGRALVVGQQRAANVPMPTLTQLSDNFAAITSPGGQSLQTALGVSFLAARSLLNTIGGTQMANLLRGVGAGKSLDSQIQATAGFNLDQLNTQYQSLIPIP